MKKIIVFLMCLLIVLSSFVYAAFNDVPEEYWAYDYIEALSNKGIINGYPDGNFGANDTLTKGAFIKLLMTASLPEVDFSILSTSSEHWALPYVQSAENYSLVEKGEINISNIDQPISRIDVVRILSLADIEVRKHEQKSVEILPFSDIMGLDIKQRILLSHAVAIGVINGYTDGTFMPENNLTRAEASKILHVYINM